MGNWLNLVIFLLIAFGPAIAKGIQKINESANEKREEKLRQDRARQQQDEMLRTGRISTTQQSRVPQASPAPRSDTATELREGRMSLEELATQRQQQLRELRRRQQQTARPQGTPSARQPSQLRPRGPQARPRQAQQQPGSQQAQRPQSRPQQLPQQQRQQQQRGVDPRLRAAQERHAREARLREEMKRDAVQRVEESARNKQEQSDAIRESEIPGRFGEFSLTHDEARRVIIFAELLGAPLALRASLDDRII